MQAERLRGPTQQNRVSLKSDNLRNEAASYRITMAGELDALTGAEVHQFVMEVLRRRRPHRIEVDLRDVRFLDSIGIRTLLSCHADARRMGCELVLTDAHPMAYRVLQITGLLDHFGLTSGEPRQER
jgi:anti-anti-sigma factor